MQYFNIHMPYKLLSTCSVKLSKNSRATADIIQVDLVIEGIMDFCFNNKLTSGLDKNVPQVMFFF